MYIYIYDSNWIIAIMIFDLNRDLLLLLYIIVVHEQQNTLEISHATVLDATPIELPSLL